jgi:hypothetical protein
MTGSIDAARTALFVALLFPAIASGQAVEP